MGGCVYSTRGCFYTLQMLVIFENTTKNGTICSTLLRIIIKFIQSDISIITFSFVRLAGGDMRRPTSAGGVAGSKVSHQNEDVT